MIKYTSLQHPTVKLNLVKAIHASFKTGGVSHVHNKKGDAYIAIRYKACNDGKMRFEFSDKDGNNMSHLIAKSYILGDNYNRPLTNLLAGRIAYKMYLNKKK